MKIKNWLIKKLGGYTEEEFKEKPQYEFHFAISCNVLDNYRELNNIEYDDYSVICKYYVQYMIGIKEDEYNKIIYVFNPYGMYVNVFIRLFAHER